jgi:hypothetical protein
VYELLGGPTRDRVRVYAHARTPEAVRQKKAEGFTAFKTGPFKRRPARFVEPPGFVKLVGEKFAELREAVGPDADIAVDRRLYPNRPRAGRGERLSHLPATGSQEDGAVGPSRHPLRASEGVVGGTV